MTRSRSSAAALLGAAFVIGGLIGGAATIVYDRKAHASSPAERPRPSFIERLSTDLSLSASQRDSIQWVLDRHQPAMDSLWQLIRPQFTTERQVIRNEISALLTPEQQAKYAELQRQDSVRRSETERNRNVHR